jgi:hypothetical protein
MFHSGILSCVSKTVAYARQYELLDFLNNHNIYSFSSAQRRERENILLLFSFLPE